MFNPFNPRMMGTMGNQNVPLVKELWKNEKSKYRHWILLFGIGILTVLSLYITSFVMNQTAKLDVIDNLIIYFQKSLLPEKAVLAANSAWRTNYLVMPLVIIGMIAIGVLYYITTVINSYQKKSFARISQWSTFVIGLGAILSFYQLFSMFWRGMEATFETPGAIFQFINYFIIIAVYFSASVRVSGIRRQFQISERFESLKNNPQMQQVQEMMQGQGMSPKNMGPFGPTMGTAQGSPNNENVKQDSSTKPTKTKEEQDLESMSVADLKKVAQKLSISGYSTMNKPELIKAILRVTSLK